MSRDLFGTDGIRGRAYQYPLTHEGAFLIGQVIGRYFAQPGEYILVGQDPRESSPMLANAVVSGITNAGVDVQNLGVLPTPGLAYLTKNSLAKAGVMITASHNPYTDNGIKILSAEGEKLSDRIEESLNELIAGSSSPSHPGQLRKGQQLLGEYENFLVSTARPGVFDGLSIVLDSANGATSGLESRVFRRLGARVTTIHDQPDGKNINADCGATKPADLQKTVVETASQAGAAFDGDGDRVILVDERGRLLTGDHILYILAMLDDRPGVVATIMSNIGLETTLAEHGKILHRTAVGDRYVIEKLHQTNLTLGGEQSGHIILREYSETGDGLLAAIQVISRVRESKKSLAAWRDDLALLPQALISFDIVETTSLNDLAAQAFIRHCSEELRGVGRLNVRMSGTEPKLRIMVEAPDAEIRATVIADELQRILGSS